MIFLLVFYLMLYFYIRKWAVKKFSINDYGWVYKPINKTQRWVELVLLLLLLGSMYLLVFVYGYSFDRVFIINFGGLGILFAIRSFMEWKVANASRRYVLSIIDSVSYFIIMILLEIITAAYIIPMVISRIHY